MIYSSASCTKKSQTLLWARAIMGPTPFSPASPPDPTVIRPCVVMVAAAGINKWYRISLGGFPTRQMIRHGKLASNWWLSAGWQTTLFVSEAKRWQFCINQKGVIMEHKVRHLYYHWIQICLCSHLAGSQACEGGVKGQRERQSKKKHLGQSFLAVSWQLQCFLVVSICFFAPPAREQ